MQHLSNAHVIAVASLSMDAYWFSALMQNLLLANIMRQSSWQHTDMYCNSAGYIHCMSDSILHMFFASHWFYHNLQMFYGGVVSQLHNFYGSWVFIQHFQTVFKLIFEAPLCQILDILFWFYITVSNT